MGNMAFGIPLCMIEASTMHLIMVLPAISQLILVKLGFHYFEKSHPWSILTMELAGIPETMQIKSQKIPGKIAREKLSELTEVVQMATVAGPKVHRGKPELVVATLGDGDAKLIIATKVKGKWSSSKSQLDEAETHATNILRQLAETKGWETKGRAAFTQAGSYLPAQPMDFPAEARAVQVPVFMRGYEQK